MKNLKLGISALALTIASTAFSQTTTNPWVIGVGSHAENHVAAGGYAGDVLSTAFGGNGGHVYSLGNYSFTSPLSKLTIARNLNKFFVLDWQTTVGNVENKKISMDNEFFLQTGLGLQFKAASLWNEDYWFDPFARVGANYLRHDYSGTGEKNGDGDALTANHFTVATGIGANFWFTKSFGLGLQGDYVFTPTNKAVVTNFWQGGATLMFRFGNTDKDKDGIKDSEDACPEVAGLAQFNGCPDTDADGVADKNDNCPEVAGPVANNGCPWPDTDKDGVVDKDDACPSVAGPAANNGCPWPDTDGDGVLDKDDKCPSVAGLAEYNGCPKPKEVVAAEATQKIQGLLFDTNKASIKKESKEILDAAAAYIKTAEGTFEVQGHTDSVGSDVYNQKLSEARAKAVVSALESRGVAVGKLTAKGYGESQPAEDNKTAAGRAKNRRVVFK